MKKIYFDAASTTIPNKEVLDVFSATSLSTFGNASSNHKLGFEADELLSKSRNQIAKYLDVKSEEIIFTSGATESNNIAIKGVALHNLSWAKNIITTKVEHPSVLNVFKKLETDGFNVTYLDCDKEGNLDFQTLEKSLDNKTSLVSIMSVNNELGFIFPLEKIYNLVHSKSKAFLHTDATQGIAKTEIKSSSYDLLSFSLHKIEGLKGCGILVKKSNVNLDSIFQGGNQEFGIRSGTSPLPLIASSATAVRLAFLNMNFRVANAKNLKDYLKKELEKIDEVEILSPTNSSPFILSFALTKHKASVISQGLSDKGIYVGSKAACSEKLKSYSLVAFNAGYSKEISENIIRLSFSGNEEISDGELFIKEIKELLSTIKESK